MPRKKAIIIDKNELERNLKKNIDFLLKNIEENQEYMIMNYYWFYDYFKMTQPVSSSVVLKYSPEEKTKNLIELNAYSKDMSVSVKIKLIKTNIKVPKILNINLNIPSSKFNNNLLLLLFENNTLVVKYSYSSISNVIDLKNDNFFTLEDVKQIQNKKALNDYNDLDISEDEEDSEDEGKSDNDDEEEEDEIEKEKKENIDDYDSDFNEEIKEFEDSENFEDDENFEEVKEDDSDPDQKKKELKEIVAETNEKTLQNKKFFFDSIIEETIIIPQVNQFVTIDIKTVKNVIAYSSIENENFKTLIKRLGNSEINISLFQNKLTFETNYYPTKRQVKIYSPAVTVNEKYFNEKISFFINNKNFSKLKSISTNFNIVPDNDKKIFKKLELKIVVNEEYPIPIYGLTISPGNLTKNNRYNEDFDIYNSVIFYLQQIKEDI